MLQKTHRSELEVLNSIDKHINFLKEGFYKRNTDECLDFGTLFEFQIKKIEDLLDELEEILCDKEPIELYFKEEPYDKVVYDKEKDQAIHLTEELTNYNEWEKMFGKNWVDNLKQKISELRAEGRINESAKN